MKCTQCGTNNFAEAPFCQGCGLRLPTGNPLEVQKSRTPSPTGEVSIEVEMKELNEASDVWNKDEITRRRRIFEELEDEVNIAFAELDKPDDSIEMRTDKENVFKQKDFEFRRARLRLERALMQQHLRNKA